MGLQFGDREGMNEYGLRILSQQDQEMLEAGEMDGERLFSLIAAERIGGESAVSRRSIRCSSSSRPRKATSKIRPGLYTRDPVRGQLASLAFY